jgi:hypothetical protein
MPGLALWVFRSISGLMFYDLLWYLWIGEEEGREGAGRYRKVWVSHAEGPQTYMTAWKPDPDFRRAGNSCFWLGTGRTRNSC